MFDRSAVQQDLDYRTLAETYYLQTLDQLSPAALDLPSLLPDWSRKHVAVHTIHNGEALMRLLHWARTGEVTPMYPSREARDQAIVNDVAKLTNADVITMSHELADELAEDFTGLTDEQWQAIVRSGQGVDIPASKVPWMRARECFVHAVDLAIGATALDFPAPVVDRVTANVLSAWAGRDEPVNFLFHVTDREDKANWLVQYGDYASVPQAEVTAQAGEIAQYVMGRGWPVDAPAELPAPPRWL